MELIYLEETESCPEVILDKGKDLFKFTGRSFPEDPAEFYIPIISWFQEYQKNPNTITIVEFKFEYFNTATSKMLYKLFLVLEELSKKHKMLIKWYFQEEDADMLSSGQMFTNLTELQFELIGY